MSRALSGESVASERKLHTHLALTRCLERVQSSVVQTRSSGSCVGGAVEDGKMTPQ